MTAFLPMPGLSARLIERFWSFADKRGPDECWPWRGTRVRSATGSMSYGRFYVGMQRFVASRIAYHIVHGGLNPAQLVCHTCDNPPCVNPAHLWLGTNADNMADMVQKGRHPRRFGEAAPRALLSDDDVRFIRQSSLPSRHLARHFGVTIGTIQKARSGISWRHIEERAAPVRGRLTEADVREIRACSLPSEYHAVRLGVHASTVRLARAGKTWGHVQ
jgi:hypothetical protein